MKTCLCLQITLHNTRGSMGESTSTRASALNLGARDSLCGLIKSQKLTLKPTPR